MKAGYTIDADVLAWAPPMQAVSSLFRVENLSDALPIFAALVLLVILIVSFRARAVVFCQYLEAMTGITLKPSDVKRVFHERGRNGVREMFLDLIIREDLKEGPMIIKTSPGTEPTPEDALIVE
jgi:hypothetical protein